MPGTNELATKADCNDLGVYNPFTGDTTEIVTYGDVTATMCTVAPKTAYSTVTPDVTATCMMYSELEPRYFRVAPPSYTNGITIVLMNRLSGGTSVGTTYNIPLGNIIVNCSITCTLQYPAYFTSNRPISGAMYSSVTDFTTSSGGAQLPYGQTATKNIRFPISYLPAWPSAGSKAQQESSTASLYDIVINISLTDVPDTVKTVFCDFEPASPAWNNKIPTTAFYRSIVNGKSNFSSQFNAITSLSASEVNNNIDVIKSLGQLQTYVGVFYLVLQ